MQGQSIRLLTSNISYMANYEVEKYDRFDPVKIQSDSLIERMYFKKYYILYQQNSFLILIGEKYFVLQRNGRLLNTTECI